MIPNGPGTDPLLLTATELEFISEGLPVETIVNQRISRKKDGTFLRIVGPQSRLTRTANYQKLVHNPTLPNLGKYTVTPALPADPFDLWVESISPSDPQAADQTISITYWVPDDVAAPEALRADVLVATVPALGASANADAIPFGPGGEPLGLAGADFEYIGLEGPVFALENESTSNTKNGLHLRTIATAVSLTYTATYQILNGAASFPRCGLFDSAAATLGNKCWVASATPSAPQDGDQTLAVQFMLFMDVATAKVEADHTDFGLREPV